MDLHHQELAYLVDKEKGDSEKRRNYGKFLRFSLKIVPSCLTEAVEYNSATVNLSI